MTFHGRVRWFTVLKMIKLILLDVGETLIHDGQPFPHVVDALAVIAQFRIDSEECLPMAVVSDYHMPTQPVTEAKILALETEFVGILGNAGLERFFQPPETRITLSSRAGVFKPNRAIFELAALRSGTNANLTECLFVTENESHLASCETFNLARSRTSGSLFRTGWMRLQSSPRRQHPKTREISNG
jgi:FMN phosphatase YigB (HAD superfamily)